MWRCQVDIAELLEDPQDEEYFAGQGQLGLMMCAYAGVDVRAWLWVCMGSIGECGPR